jgi:outer membrane protein assembly factor BamB
VPAAGAIRLVAVGVAAIAFVGVLPAGAAGTSTKGAELIALDAATGARDWAVSSDGARRTAAVAGASGGRVFAVEVPCVHGGEDTQATRAAVAGFRASDGRRLWRHEVVARFGAVGEFAVGTTVVVMQRDGSLAGLAPATGDTRWHTGTRGLSLVGGSRTFVVLGPFGIDFAPGGPGELRAVERRTGRARWKVALEQDVVLDQPIVADESTVVALVAHVVPLAQAENTNGGLYVGRFELRAFDARTGGLRWSRPVAQPGSFRALSLGDPLVVWQADATVGYDLATGAERWRLSIDRSLQVAIDRRSGKPQWTTQLLPGGASVIVGDAPTIVIADFGRVLVVDAATGVSRWAQDAPIGSTTAVLHGGRVYAGGGCEYDE